MKKPAFILLLIATVVASVIAATSIANDRAGWLVSPGELSNAHAMLDDRCSSCHAPYERIRGQACVRCHAVADRLLAQTRTRFHAYVPSCIECHREHDGGSRPTKMDHAALETLLAEREPSFRAQELACASCHRAEEPHGKKLGEDCASCHGTETWSIDGFLHPSPRSRECSRCHAAPPSHYMEHFVMMSKPLAGVDAPVEQCFHCHQTNAWNDIANRGFIDHH